MNNMLELKNIITTSGYVPLFILGVSTELTLILAILLIIDTITGIIKSYYIKRAITSNRLSRGVISKLLLLIIPFVITLAGAGVGIDLTFIAQGAMGMLCLAEAYSIIGNIYAVRTQQEMAEFDAISFVLKKINKLLKIIIEDKK